MIPKSGYRFSEKIMLNNNVGRDDDSKKSHLALAMTGRQPTRGSHGPVDEPDEPYHRGGNHPQRPCHPSIAPGFGGADGRHSFGRQNKAVAGDGIELVGEMRGTGEQG